MCYVRFVPVAQGGARGICMGVGANHSRLRPAAQQQRAEASDYLGPPERLALTLTHWWMRVHPGH